MKNAHPQKSPETKHPDGSPGEVYHQRFAVEFDYPVYFTRKVFDLDNRVFVDTLNRRAETRRHRVFVVTDAGVAEHHPDLAGRIAAYCAAEKESIELVGAPLIVPGGESIKNDMAPVEDLVRSLGRYHLCRQSCVVAIGGGSVLDMVGFAASLVHRGLRLVRLPTTVLAQNDAGVGVKTGMNDGGVKNFVGTFAPPFAVINDFDFLETLPEVHWRGGIAEAFKVAIIKDALFFKRLCADADALRRRDPTAMEDLVRRCAALHLEHIAMNGDPFEMGTARPLDFGHWMAHKLEALSEYRITHGEAVAAGIALDSFYAARKGLIGNDDLSAILDGLTRCGFRVWHDEMGQRGADGRLEILTGLDDFREHLGGLLTVTLPDGLGQKCEVHEMDASLIEAGIDSLKDHDS